MQNPKGKRNEFLQVETEPYKDETLAASSGRNTQDSFTGAEEVLMGLPKPTERLKDLKIF